jgi:N-acetyl-gamma-glutamyl-phosphate reductase
MATGPEPPVPVSVVGATGYTGSELIRLVLAHPRLSLGPLVGQSNAGRPVADALPSLAGVLPPDQRVAPFDPDRLAEAAPVAFCALPHGASAPAVDALRSRGVLVLDLSADFRLADLDEHVRRYGPHGAPDRRGEAVYGLPELHRESLRNADLVAVPGCFPTAAILALAPLLAAGLVHTRGIVVDAKTGASGAGRAVSAATHFSETAEGVRPYKPAGSHRHTPEIIQELTRVAGAPVGLTFTPHLVPMVRGILATCYGTLSAQGTDAATLTAAARERFADAPAVAVLPTGALPGTQAVRGGNRVQLSYAVDPGAGVAVAFAAIDNLVKGAAGQAVQCLNLRLGWPELLGLDAAPVWP